MVAVVDNGMLAVVDNSDNEEKAAPVEELVKSSSYDVRMDDTGETLTLSGSDSTWR